jgi:predicted aspartyl protease
MPRSVRVIQTALLLAFLVGASGLIACGGEAASTREPAPTKDPAASSSSGAEADRIRDRIEARKRAHALEVERERLRNQNAQSVVLPLQRLDSGHITVPVDFEGGEPMTFILDTGASMTVITQSTLHTLALDFSDNDEVQAAGAGGETSARVKLGTLPEFSVAQRRYSDLMVAVMDLSHLEAKMERPIHGVLGKNFLSKHDVEVDFARSELRLHGTGSRAAMYPEALSGMQSVEFDTFPRSGLIRIHVGLNGGETMPAILDLGAGGSVLNWHAARAAGIDPDSEGVTSISEALQGADKNAIAAKVYRFRLLQLGPVIFKNPRLLIADMAVFETMGVAEGPAMIFGVDLLHDRRILIDYSNHVVHLSKP